MLRSLNCCSWRTSESALFNCWKVGLLSGSYAQHCVNNEYSLEGHDGGKDSLSPLSNLPITSPFFTPWKGLIPNIKISHTQTPESLERIKLLVVDKQKLLRSSWEMIKSLRKVGGHSVKITKFHSHDYLFILQKIPRNQFFHHSKLISRNSFHVKGK